VKRILTATERLLVMVAPDQDRMLWSLWAAKEAAFKAWSRTEPDLVFSPASFEVVVDPGSGGATVRRVGTALVLAVRWTQNAHWVHAVASESPGALGASVETISGNESEAVRALAVRALTRAGYPAGGIEDRPPVYRWPGGETPVSLSHDGPYGAVVFSTRP
jgi:hypothetical protein